MNKTVFGTCESFASCMESTGVTFPWNAAKASAAIIPPPAYTQTSPQFAHNCWKSVAKMRNPILHVVKKMFR